MGRDPLHTSMSLLRDLGGVNKWDMRLDPTHLVSEWLATFSLGTSRTRKLTAFTDCPFSCARVLMDPLVLLSHWSATPRTMLCIISLFLTSVESSWEWFLPSLGELDTIALRVGVSKWRVTWNKTLSWLKKNWWGGYWECQLCLSLLLKPIFQSGHTSVEPGKHPLLVQQSMLSSVPPGREQGSL